MIRSTVPMLGLALALLAAAPAQAQAQDRPAQPAPQARIEGVFAALYVADADGMADWYGRNLGFEAVTRGERPQGPVSRFALMRRQGAILEILQLRRSDAPRPSGERPTYDALAYGVIKLGFMTDDIEKLDAELTARGAVFNHHIVRSRELGLRTFAVRDPEGNTVQVFGG